MSDYRIAAIPTVYRGRRYRSRLEARWAAFFDLLDWKHEYEPFDLGEWTPDFIMREGIDCLVEIKPISAFDRKVWDRIALCAEEHSACPSIFLSRVAPEVIGSAVEIGWLSNRFDRGKFPEPTAVRIVWGQGRHIPAMKALIMNARGIEWLAEHGFSEDSQYVGTLRSYAEHTMSIWAKATSEVQWRPEARS